MYKHFPEYASSLKINKLQGINRIEKGWWLSFHSFFSVTNASPLELSGMMLFFNFGWGVKSITTGDPRDKIATTGKYAGPS